MPLFSVSPLQTPGREEPEKLRQAEGSGALENRLEKSVDVSPDMADTLFMQTEMTIPQAARELGLGITRTRQLVLEGRIPSRIVGPVRIIRGEDLDAFAQVPRKPGRPRKNREEVSA